MITTKHKLNRKKFDTSNVNKYSFDLSFASEADGKVLNTCYNVHYKYFDLYGTYRLFINSFEDIQES